MVQPTPELEGESGSPLLRPRPAITWTAIQANPERLASTLWFVDYFAAPDQLRAERGYAYANLQAAVSFARTTLVDAAPLDGLISSDRFDRGVKTATLTHKAVLAARAKDARQLRLLLAGGADALGLGLDLDASPLSEAISSRHRDSIAAAFERLSPPPCRASSSPSTPSNAVELQSLDVDAYATRGPRAPGVPRVLRLLDESDGRRASRSRPFPSGARG